MTGGYGGPDIITSCTIGVNKGEIVTILGPNGAGKSTAMRALLGMLNLREGKITINEKDISNLSPQDRVKEGISFVPQTKNVFTTLTVEENLEMGAYLRDESFQDTLDEIFRLFPKKIRKWTKWAVLLILLVFLLRHSYGWSLIQSQNIYLIANNSLNLEFLTLIHDIEDQSYKKTVSNHSQYEIGNVELLSMMKPSSRKTVQMSIRIALQPKDHLY